MFTPSCHVVSSVSLMLSPTADLMSFDELSYTSEKLSHPTANRPKMPGRRLPAQFGGTQSVSKLFFFFFSSNESQPATSGLQVNSKEKKSLLETSPQRRLK